jgi:hypothetical protein
LACIPSVTDIMVAGDNPPADSEFVHQMAAEAEVSFESGPIESHIASMNHEIGMLGGDPRCEWRPIVEENWLVLAQMRVGNLHNPH